jgi:hypothetical protein
MKPAAKPAGAVTYRQHTIVVEPGPNAGLYQYTATWSGETTGHTFGRTPAGARQSARAAINRAIDGTAAQQRAMGLRERGGLVGKTKGRNAREAFRPPSKGVESQ